MVAGFFYSSQYKYYFEVKLIREQKKNTNSSLTILWCPGTYKLETYDTSLRLWDYKGDSVRLWSLEYITIVTIGVGVYWRLFPTTECSLGSFKFSVFPPIRYRYFVLFLFRGSCLVSHLVNEWSAIYKMSAFKLPVCLLASMSRQTIFSLKGNCHVGTRKSAPVVLTMKVTFYSYYT